MSDGMSIKEDPQVEKIQFIENDRKQELSTPQKNYEYNKFNKEFQSSNSNDTNGQNQKSEILKPNIAILKQEKQDLLDNDKTFVKGSIKPSISKSCFKNHVSTSPNTLELEQNVLQNKIQKQKSKHYKSPKKKNKDSYSNQNQYTPMKKRKKSKLNSFAQTPESQYSLLSKKSSKALQKEEAAHYHKWKLSAIKITKEQLQQQRLEELQYLKQIENELLEKINMDSKDLLKSSKKFTYGNFHTYYDFSQRNE